MFKILEKNKYYIIIFFITGLFLFNFHLIGHNNYEYFNNDFITNIKFARSLLNDFHYPHWNEDLAFGIPFELNPNQKNNPLVFFFGIKNINLGLSIFYQFFLFYGAVYIFRTSKFFKISKNISLVCTITYLGCSASADWVYLKFLPSAMFSWSLLPILIYYYLLFLNINKNKEKKHYGFIFAFLFGLIILNSHPPIIILYSIFFFLISLIFFKNFIFNIKIILILCICSLFILTPKIFVLWNEFLLFDTNLPRNIARLTDNKDWLNYVLPHSFFLKPLIIPFETFKEFKSYFQDYNNFSLIKLFTNIQTDFENGFYRKFLGSGIDERDFFIGPIFAFIFIFFFIDVIKNKKFNNEFKILIISILLFIFFIFAPSFILNLIQRDFFFRDLIFIFIIFLSGIFLTKTNSKLALFLIFFHLLFICIVYISHNLNSFRMNEKNNFLFTKKIINYGKIDNQFSKLKIDNNQRIYLTETAGHNFPSKGLNYYYNYLEFIGYKIINSNTKGISLDIFYPSKKKFEGEINGDKLIQNNQWSQFFLRIKYLIASKDENYSKNLKIKGTIVAPDGKEYLILENKNFSEFAYKLNSKFLNKERVYLDNCLHQKILCLRFDDYKNFIISSNVLVKRKNSDVIEIQLNSIKKGEVLIIPEMFRDEWEINNKNYEILRVFNGFIGIKFKEKVSNKLGNNPIILKYYPRKLMFFKALSLSVFVFYIILIVFYRRQCKRKQL